MVTKILKYWPCKIKDSICRFNKQGLCLFNFSRNIYLKTSNEKAEIEMQRVLQHITYELKKKLYVYLSEKSKAYFQLITVVMTLIFIVFIIIVICLKTFQRGRQLIQIIKKYTRVVFPINYCCNHYHFHYYYYYYRANAQ